MDNLAEKKPHAVLIPFPAQGHINSLFKLAKLLHFKGFHITFVNTEYNHKRLLKSMDSNSLDGFDGFSFETIPDGLTEVDGNGDVTQNEESLRQSIRKNFLRPFSELLTKLHDSAIAGVTLPVTCIVSDIFMPFTIQAAEEHVLPILLYSPASAAGVYAAYHFRTLVEKGVIPFKDDSYLTNGYLDTKVDCIPGWENFRLKDIPDYIRTTDPNDTKVEFIIESADRFHKASSIIINSYNELESDVMNQLNSVFPSIYTIGPLSSFLNQIPQNNLVSLGSNLWKEDTKCLEWLESKDPGSVVYVNFGSIIVLSQEQLEEFAWGLANSMKPFLWIVRPDLITSGSFILSSVFQNEISNRGFIASWCPQEKVLNHPSIGGFLTHCGWNSVIESICAGVPMLCWPFCADQPTNCKFICNIWETGIEIDPNVKRENLGKSINELMVGEKAKKMKQNAMELKKKAEENTSQGGCSYMNLDKVIKEVLLKQH
ncbi:unnamed protein product [Trifolium pratense]|uniref:Uncharacterized protein n=2 Tax=Trifolium pratense TaxID=57577 RepID=A0ACB0LBJ9_TRIPR|nr:unnamed protein product [Trifolium pratense]CAJ2665774.1 unnamed protein product [Trifolium pratense]